MNAPLDEAQRTKEIFLELALIDDADSREAAVDRLTGDDHSLKKRVLSLLQADDDKKTGLLDRVGKVLGGRAAVDRVAITAEMPGSDTFSKNEVDPSPRIGPYTLMEKIGEGGMGVVYVAQQHLPIRRMVALKLIKPGMDSKQVVARFEAERQTLAMMNHSNIAKVLDAGTTEAGLPYFVMELVKGTPITEYCDAQRLDLQQRLELFIKVCEAVQHAHQKGIIHCDLKPSNVLVELEDVRSVPKVIDFGIAKAMQQQLTEDTVYTGIAQIIGTPLYMSPEQAQLNSLDVDVRSDVYSLGVILYELIAGSTPFDREILKKVGFDEMRRIIREDEPARPSSRVSTLQDELSTTVCERRQTNLKQLSRTLKGELDWIALKALEKDRIRRYQSASDFSADIRRLLKGERVLACPPNWRYRTRKWAKRHKMLLASASFAVLSLVGGTGISLLYSVKANRSLVIANDAEQLASQRLEQVLTAQAEANNQAKMVERAASVIVNRDINQVENLLRQLLVEQEERLGESDPTVIATINRLGVICDEQGRLSEGEAHYRMAIARCKVSESVEPDTQLEIMENLAGNLAEQARYEEAEAAWREVAERYRDRYGSKNEKTVNADMYVGIMLSNQFRYEDAIAKYHELLQQVTDDSEGTQALRWSIARCQDKLHEPLDRLYYESGVGACKKGKWSLASANFQKAMQKDPGNPVYWYTIALADILGEDTSRYRQHCEVLLRVNSQFEDPRLAYWMVKSLVLHPQSPDDWNALIAKASPVLNASNSEPVWKATLGAAMCRGKKFQEASKHLRAVVEQDDSGIGRLWLAFALWHLGDHASAREELRRAERQLEISHIDAQWYLREGDGVLIREFRSTMGIEILPNGERREQ